MTEKQLHEAAWLANPYVWKNSRGSYRTPTGYITYGFPPPPHGKREKPDDVKGHDLIGFREVAITPDMVGKTIGVFLGIELKTENDRLAPGQKKFHNFLLDHGCLSEIHHYKKGQIEITKTRLT